MQVHNSMNETVSAMHQYTDPHLTAEALAASYLSRKPGLVTNEQRASHLFDQMTDEQRQAEDLLISTPFDDAPADHGQPGVVHFSKTHAADAELDADGGIHLVPVRAKN